MGHAQELLDEETENITTTENAQELVFLLVSLLILFIVLIWRKF